MYKHYLKISLVGLLIIIGTWLAYKLSQPLVSQTFSQVMIDSKNKGLTILTNIVQEPPKRTVPFKFFNNGIIPSIIYILCIILLCTATYKLFFMLWNTKNLVHKTLFIISIICLISYWTGKVLIWTIAGGFTMIFWYALIMTIFLVIFSGIFGPTSNKS